MKLNGHNLWKDIMGSLIITMLIIGLGVIIFKKNIENVNLTLMYDNCCNGSECTDTYYTPEDNTCHLVLCEGLFHAEHSIYGNCTYAGANLTITVIQ
jgi:hypothetical protein